MDILTNHKLQVLQAILLVMLPSCGFYLSFVYLPSYLEHYLHIRLAQALMANTLTMLVIIFFIPMFGLISDLFGRKLILKAGSLAFLFLSPLLYVYLPKAGIYSVYLCLIVFAFMVACSYSVIPAVLVELFETQSRLTGMSLPYNIANAMFGGTAPLMATLLIYITNSLIAPGIYLSVIALITFITIFFMDETYKQSLYE